jgi:two-component system response regulator HupR/HoxA
VPEHLLQTVRAAGSPLDAVCETARLIARHDLSVRVLGESGTGKELLARAIHYASPRHAGPYGVENCAATPDTLLESELFDHKRGAFTGAADDHIGLFQRANGGTVLLDEIGETSPAFQVKLLRVLQEGELRPVGSSRRCASGRATSCRSPSGCAPTWPPGWAWRRRASTATRVPC